MVCQELLMFKGVTTESLISELGRVCNVLLGLLLLVLFYVVRLLSSQGGYRQGSRLKEALALLLGFLLHEEETSLELLNKALANLFSLAETLSFVPLAGLFL
jgi:hypothetical protein